MKVAEKIKELFFSDRNETLLRNIVILGMVGVVLLFAGSIIPDGGTTREDDNFAEKKSSEQQHQEAEKSNYLTGMKEELTRVISAIKGVGDVEVQIYVEEGTSYEYEYNISEDNKITNERDQEGGNREINEDDYEQELVIIQDGAGNEKPVIRREKKPEIRGVLIVAEGAGVSSCKQEIFRAVQGLLDLPAHRINVLPQ